MFAVFSFTIMSLQSTVVLLALWVTFWLSNVLMTVTSEVTLVNRNATDSFRVGENSCKLNTSHCPNSATCQSDSGLCLCNNSQPNFLSYH